MKDLSLRALSKVLLLFFSFLVVAFGQPALWPVLGIAASVAGYALFFRVMLSFGTAGKRFAISLGWFAAVQLVQLFWMTTHPYSYIYLVWALLSLGVGAQFGILSFLLHPKRFTAYPTILAAASLWTLIEWSRLFLLSGYAFNPVGLSLASSLYTLQFASLFGVFGLSFLVMLTNLLVLKAWMENFSAPAAAAAGAACLIPWIFGVFHVSYHDYNSRVHTERFPQLSVILAEPSFPVEETLNFKGKSEFFQYVISEWKRLLSIVGKHQGKKADLIVLPELVVPFGTYTFLYDYDETVSLFRDAFGEEAIKSLPPKELPLAYRVEEDGSLVWKVNNAYWAQALANLFSAVVVIGLEDAEDKEEMREYYSAAILLRPFSSGINKSFEAERYEKRVLVPMGEYIPFSFCRELAAKYGVFGSFTPGCQSKVFNSNEASFGISICYEEMFGNLMRESRQLGADFFVNITNDAWFPGSLLPKQHLEHSRLRTVENGVALVRACNTGVTCVVDSLGRDVALLEKDRLQSPSPDSLHATFTAYNYQTLYARFGDPLVLGVSLFFLLLFLAYNSSVRL